MTPSPTAPCPHCTHPAPTSSAFCPVCGGSLHAYSHALPAGTVLRGGQYLLERPLGAGGFGLTYQALDSGLQATVAVKELFPVGVASRGPQGTLTLLSGVSSVDFAKLKAAAFGEARRLFDLRDPGIVRVLAVWEERNTVFLAMEYLEGESLGNRLEGHILDEPEARALMVQVLQALEKVHAAGMLHRDLKPDNLMLTGRYGPVLIDFGTALDFEQGKTLQLTSRFLTPHYAPPEQYASQVRLGPPTDLYALGATLYHALSGTPPPTALDRMQGVNLPSLHTLRRSLQRSALSNEFGNLLERCLNLKFSERPADAQEALHILEGVVRPSPLPVPAIPLVPVPIPMPPLPTAPTAPVVPPPPAGPAIVQPSRSRGWLYALLGLGLLGGGFWLYSSKVLPTNLSAALTPPSSLSSLPRSSAATLPGVSTAPTSGPFKVSAIEVLLPKVNVRSGPGTGYSVLQLSTGNQTVSRGQRLLVLAEQSGWTQVSTATGPGWVSSRLTLPTAPLMPSSAVDTLITQLEAGGDVTLEAGIYLLPRPLSLSQPFTLSGAGVGQSFLLGSAPGAVLEYQGTGELALSDLTLGRQGNSAGQVLDVSAETLSLERVRVMGGLDKSPWQPDDGEEGDGLVLRNSTQATVTDSEFLANGWRGMQLLDSARVVSTNSQFAFNSGSGIVMKSQSSGSFERNTLASNTLAGIKVLESSSATLSANTFENNRNALYLGESVSGSFENNVCISFTEDILLEGPSTEMTLEGNRCPKITAASSTPDFRRVLNLDWGYALDAPDSWKLSFEEKAGVRSLSWTDPQNPRVKILLQVTRTPTSDALSGWYEAEVDLQRRYGTGYQRIALEPSSVAGSEDAARWEFLLERPEGIQHKLDLGAVCGGKGYGLLVEAPTEEWAGYETQLLGVLESFECL